MTGVSETTDALTQKTGQFMLALLQAFLRTGYYLPEHPESRKAKAGLYNQFISLFNQPGEITLLHTQDQAKPTVIIEGLAEKAIKLHECLTRSMAETYLPKLIQFLERKELVALTLSSRMEQSEFSYFIDIMSEPAHTPTETTSTRAAFTDSLKQKHIYNLSFIFNSDVISHRSNLPWRARMALSRLKKDIHLLPILRNLEEHELHDIKIQILTDILRPLLIPELVYSFIMNLDLASSDLMSEEIAEEHSLQLISDDLIQSVSIMYLHDATAVNAQFPDHVSSAKKARVLAGFCQRLNSSKHSQAGNILESLFNKGLIKVEDLPAALKNRILTIKRMMVFLSNPVKFLRALDLTVATDIYTFRAQTLTSFMPYLIERGRLEEAIQIIRMLNYHARENSSRSTAAINRRAEIVFSDTPIIASKIFLTATKEIRTSIGNLFILLGHGAIPHIQQILIDSDDLWRSKQAAETLVALGSNAIKSLITATNASLFHPASLTAVLKVLSSLSSSPFKKEIILIFLNYARSPHSDIRRECLAGLCRLDPVSGFDTFAVNIQNTDPKIRKISIRGLGLSGDRKAFMLLSKIIAQAEATNWHEDLEFAAIAIKSLGALAENCAALRIKVYEYLTTMVDKHCCFWSSLVSRTPSYPDAIVLALAEAIVKQRSAAMQTLFQKLSQHSCSRNLIIHSNRP